VIVVGVVISQDARSDSGPRRRTSHDPAHRRKHL
jgi:hypothetical protein